jgi:DNA-directed RNA polymerase specialized sigma24 family protein
MEPSPDRMPLSLLISHCGQEISNYHQGNVSDERYCLEIFRRALVDDDNDSWAALQEQFQANVVFWLRRHSRRQDALQIESEQNYVDDTFKRLWQWGHNQRKVLDNLADFDGQKGFRSLAGALAFLRSCLESLIRDNLRACARQQHVPLPEYDLPVAASAEAEIERQELWRVIHTILTTQQEMRVIFLLYHEGLKPRDIVQRYPAEFASVQKIYGLTKNAMDRLKRHSAIIRQKIDYEGI